MIGERRRPLIDADLVIRASLAWLLMAAVLLIAGLPAISARNFHEGDDIMRLLEVRDWLAGQSWFDVSQYRIDAPYGAGMHWSRLVDVPWPRSSCCCRPSSASLLPSMWRRSPCRSAPCGWRCC